MENSVLTAEDQPVIDSAKSHNLRFIPIIQILLIVVSTYAAIFAHNSLEILSNSGTVFLLFYIAPLVITPIVMLGIGHLADTRGRKTTLLACEAVIAITVVVPFSAAKLGLGLGPLSWIILLVGPGVNASIVIMLQAMASDSTMTQHRTQIFGLVLALPAFGGASFFLPYILLSRIPFGFGPLFVFIVLAATIYLTTVKLHEVYSRDRQDLPSIRRRMAMVLKTLFRPQVLILFILIAAQAVFMTVFSGYLSLLKLSRTGQWAGLQDLVPVLAILVVEIMFIGKLSRWLGDRRLAYVGLTLLLIGILLVIATPTQAVPGYSKEDMTRLATVRDYAHRDGKTTSVPLPLDEHNGWTALIWFYVAATVASIGVGLLTPPLYSLLTRQTQSSDWGKFLGVASVLALLIPDFFPRPNVSTTVLDNPALPFIALAGVFAVLLAVAMFALPHPAPEKHGDSIVSETPNAMI